MLARRLLVLLAVMVGLTALAAGMAPRRTGPALGPAEPLPQEPAAAPARTVPRTLGGDQSGGGRRIVARSGDTLLLTVTASSVDSVSGGGLGESGPGDPEAPAELELVPDEAGSYPIELLESGRGGGTLVG